MQTTLTPKVIEDTARLIDALHRQQRVARLTVIDSTSRVMYTHVKSWRNRLRDELSEQLAALEVGCPPSFVRVAGQSHLEKPFNRLLGWMVNPAGDHGWGDAFLRLLAERVGLPEITEDLETGEQPEIRVEQTLDGDDSGKEPDLAIRTRRGALLLENKVHALESGDQYGPYLDAFRSWSVGRSRKAVLTARDARAVPESWDLALRHEDIAGLLMMIADELSGVPVWSRICAAICAVALRNETDYERVRAARAYRDALDSSAPSAEQVFYLRKLLPLPTPIVPWNFIES